MVGAKARSGMGAGSEGGAGPGWGHNLGQDQIAGGMLEGWMLEPRAGQRGIRRAALNQPGLDSGRSRDGVREGKGPG